MKAKQRWGRHSTRLENALSAARAGVVGIVAVAVVRVLAKTATSVTFYESLARDNVGTWAPDYLIEVDDGARLERVSRSQWSWE